MQLDRGPGASELASAQISGPPVTVAHPQTAAPWEGNSTERAKANKSELD